MCEAIAGIGVETHDLAHPLPTLQVDVTPCTNLYFKWMVRVRVRVRGLRLTVGAQMEESVEFVAGYS